MLEDLGALIGLFFAMTGVVLVKITGNARFDAVGSLAIGILLCTIAIVLAVEMKGLLIGESASPDDQRKIAEAIKAAPNVLGIIHLRTEHLGPEELLMGAKIEFSHTLTLPQLADAIDEVEREVRAAVPSARVIYIEPDIRRA